MPPILKRDRARDILVIVLAWTATLAFQGGLQLAGQPVGFDVAPLGEDWAWMLTLQGGNSGAIAQRMWGMFDRNPLLVWWYIGAKPLILNLDSGLLLLRHAMRLAVAISTYLVFVDLTRSETRSLALGSAVLIAIFTANGYPDNLQWPLLGVLTLSLGVIWCYSRFLEGERKAYGWYVTALMLWFIAITSYTLQSGAVLAIALLAARPPSGEPFWSRRHLLRALGDLAPFVLIFVIYGMIWKTVSNPALAIYYELKPSLVMLFRSVWLGLWHLDYPLFWTWFGGPLNKPQQGAAFLTFALLIYALLRWAGPNLGAALATPWKALVPFLFAVCIVIPTVVVETTASQTWVPGSRWRMVQPFWLPVLCVTLLTCLVLPVWRSRHAGRIWSGGVAGVGAFLLLIGFGFSEQQVRTTHLERAFREQLQRIVEEDIGRGMTPPRTYIVKLAPSVRWMSADALSPTYAANWFPGQDITFRIVQKEPVPEPSWASWWRIGFGPDEVGVVNGRVGGQTIPFSRVELLEFDGANFARIGGATSQTFAGLQVDWNRDAPIPRYEPPAQVACPVEWAPASDPGLPGWSVGEKDSSGSFRWTVARSAALIVPRCGSFMEVEVLATAISPENVERLRVRIDGQEVDVARTATPGGILVSGRVALTEKPTAFVKLELLVPKLDRVAGAGRRFGIAVRAVRVRSGRPS